MTARLRTADGGRIDRSQTLDFSFDGRCYRGHPGDTLASALVANGVRLVGRSFKYHRPRGIVTAGSEEPNALVAVGDRALLEPNARATTVELYNGLVARSQNAWPSLAWDAGALNNLVAPILPAGFYYKTFFGPASRWTRRYEPFIRRMAGLGPAPTDSDPETYEKRHAHCEVLVVGAGPAGLMAATAAAEAGARVILIDERAWAGGSLAGSDDRIDGQPGSDWAAATAARLAANPDVRMLIRTTAFGLYDQGLAMAVERCTDHLPPSERHGPRQRLWQIRAARIVLATGAHEQPLLFAGNDVPGVMLAGAAAAYAVRHGALVGRRVVVAGGNDAAHAAAAALAARGVAIAAIIDPRGGDGPSPVIADAVAAVRGRKAVRGCILSRGQRIDCDAVLMSGGWQPALHLFSHAGGRIVHDAARGCFLPQGEAGVAVAAGAAAGDFTLAAVLAAGAAAGRAAVEAAGRAACMIAVPATPAPLSRAPVAVPPQSATAFVDYQNDVKLADLDLATREGFVSVEHLKRYTTTGMATDQGKLSNLNAINRLAENLGCAPAVVGTTSFRPPYTPVTFGALAARDRGDRMDPIRVTPMHDAHIAAGAVFEDVGQWKRPHFYPRQGEDMQQAVRRECRAVRSAAGMLDASTLGKIDVQGPDAARFLNLVYTNGFLKLEVGKCRYGVMLKDDGMVFDDGVTARIGHDRFLMTTTTGNAARVMDHLEDYLQTEWPHLKLFLTSVTEQWAATVVTGPRARDVLAGIVDADLSAPAFPHLAWRDTVVAGEIPARLYRISFTGELSFEVHVPAQFGAAAWAAIARAGAAHGITPYGTEAMHVLRAEKGYIIIGQEADGTVSPDDLGLSWAVARSKPDFIGKRSLARADLARDDRRQLVGLRPLDEATVLPEGAQLTAAAGGAVPVPMLGHVTSSYWSDTVGGPFALALVKGGRSRVGETVIGRWGDAAVPCRITGAIFHDPAGAKMHG